jgi:arginase
MSLRTVHILGVPFNSAGRSGGVAGGPDALRRAGLLRALDARGLKTTDRGNVSLGEPAQVRDPASLVTAPEALAAMIRRTRTAVRAIVDEGGLPLVIGGDCPVLIACLAAVQPAAPPGLLFIDGHEDAWPPGSSTTGEAADMELGFLLHRTTDRLPPELLHEIPHLATDRVVALGPRDAIELAEAGVPSVRDAVPIISPESIARDPARVGKTSAARVAATGSWWLHVDLDVLCSESLSAVDYPQPGGLSWKELTALTTHAVGVRGLLGLDVTIYNPDLDPAGIGAESIVRYLAATMAAIDES